MFPKFFPTRVKTSLVMVFRTMWFSKKEKKKSFKNAEQSVILLMGRINELRQFDEKELKEIEAYQEKDEE